VKVKKNNIPVVVYSVIYNTPAHYLRRAIESILAQSWKDFEYAIFDNASTGETKDIINEYAEKDKRIRLTRFPENIAFSNDEDYKKECNYKILDAIDKEYCCTLDSDDYYEPGFLELLLALATEFQTDVVACNTMFHEEGTDRAWLRIPAETKGLYQGKSSIADMLCDYYGLFRPLWGKIYRSELYKKYYKQYIESPDIGAGSDTERNILILGDPDCNKVLITGKVMHHYTVRKQSESRTLYGETGLLDKHITLYTHTYNVLQKAGRLTQKNIMTLNSVLLAGVFADDFTVMELAKDKSPAEVFLVLEKITTCGETGGFREFPREYLDQVMDMACYIQKNNMNMQKIKKSFLFALASVYNRSAGFTKNIDRQTVLHYMRAVLDKKNKYHFGANYVERLFACYGSELAKIISRIPMDAYVKDGDLLDVVTGKDKEMILKKATQICEECCLEELKDVLKEYAE